MHPTPGVRSLLACYERAISDNEKAGVKSRMFLSNIAKQPTSRPSRIRPRQTPVSRAATSVDESLGKGSSRHASLPESNPPAKVMSPASGAGKSSRIQLTRSSSARSIRKNVAGCSATGPSPPSALEHRLGKHGAIASTRFGKSDTTISTAGSSIPDDVEEASWSLAGGNFGLDEGSDEDDRKASRSFFPFTQRRSAPPAVGLRDSLAVFQPEAPNVPVSLRSFHRSSSVRSLQSASDNEDEDSNGFKVLVHRQTGGLDNGASLPGKTRAKDFERPQSSPEESPGLRDSTLSRQSSSRSIRSTTSRTHVHEELDGASNSSVRDHRSTRSKPQRSSPTKERSAIAVSAGSKDDQQGSNSSICSHHAVTSSRSLTEKTAGGERDRKVGDLDASSRHSVTSPRTRRSKPISTTDALTANDSKDVHHKARSASSPSKSKMDKTKPRKTGPSSDTESKPSSKVKNAGDEPRLQTGRSPARSQRLASSKRRNHEEGESGREESPSPSWPARPAPTERNAAAATKVDPSPVSPTASHHGSWTLAFDHDGAEIDISPGSTTRSPKVKAVSKKKASPSSSSSSTKRPATKASRKEPGTRRVASAKASASGSSSPPSTRATSGAKVKASSSRARVRVVESPSLSPTAAATAQPKVSSLERRRQRYLERITVEPGD